MFFTNLRLYTLTQPLTLTASALESALASKPHREPASQEMSTAGFVPALGEGATLLAHAGQGAYLVAMKTSTRDLKGSVVNEAVKAKVKAIEAEQQRKVYKKERDQIKDELLQTMLPRAFVTHKTTYAVLDLVEQRVLVNTQSPGAAEAILSTLRECLGSLPVRPLTVKINPQATMTHWLKTQETPEGFYLADNCELEESADGGGVVKLKRIDLSSEEVQMHLATGKLCRNLSLAWGDKLTFDLVDDMGIRRLSFADLLEEQAADEADSEDPLSYHDVSFVIMLLTLREFLAELLPALGGEEIPQGVSVEQLTAAPAAVGAGVDVTNLIGLAGTGVTATLSIPPAPAGGAVDDGDGPDPIMQEARDFVRAAGRGSVSAIQRRFKVGYNRAARVVEALEAEGILSPMRSDGSRVVLA